MMNSKTIILPLSIFAPTKYFKILLSEADVYIDPYENFVKQSYRNRIKILGANGPLNLSIPVKSQFGKKKATSLIEIDNSKDWKRQHWRSIVSAYRSAPFFEHYEEKIKIFFQKDFKTLEEFALESIKVSMDIIKASGNFKIAKEYLKDADMDYRDSFKEKDLKNWNIKISPYPQVFIDRFNFTDNLSILDLIFNEGPASKHYL